MPVPLPPEAKKVFQGEMISVYQWPQKMYDGTIQTFETIIRADTATVVAFLDPNTILLTKQEQPHKKEPFWAIPGGRVDPGETADHAALRELREETGYVAGRILLWKTVTWNGLQRFEEFIYVATDLSLHPEGNHEDAGEKIKLVQTPWSDVRPMCLQQKFRGATVSLTILGMFDDPEQKARLKAFLSAK